MSNSFVFMSNMRMHKNSKEIISHQRPQETCGLNQINCKNEQFMINLTLICKHKHCVKRVFISVCNFYATLLV